MLQLFFEAQNLGVCRIDVRTMSDHMHDLHVPNYREVKCPKSMLNVHPSIRGVPVVKKIGGRQDFEIVFTPFGVDSDYLW